MRWAHPRRLRQRPWGGGATGRHGLRPGGRAAPLAIPPLGIHPLIISPLRARRRAVTGGGEAPWLGLGLGLGLGSRLGLGTGTGLGEVTMRAGW